MLATPHLGYVEQDGYELYFEAAFRNVVNFAAGTPTNILNPAGGLAPQEHVPSFETRTWLRSGS